MITMKQIAERVGVSVATVSYVLNDSGSVSEKTKKAIMDIINEEGYTPNRIAKGLRGNRTDTIGVLVEDITSFQTPRIINGINTYMEKKGYHILLSDLGLLKKTGNDIDKIPDFKEHIKEEAQILISAKVDGIIYIAMHDRNVEDILPELSIPLVCGYCYSDSHKGIYVTYDNKQISSDITQMLIDKGHTDIGIIWGRKESRPAQMRFEGFLTQLEQNGLSVREECTFYGDWEFESGKKAFKKYNKLNKKPTAIFAMNDLMGLGFMDAALESGLQLPQDISVVGFDNRESCQFYRPRLTTVDVPLEKMGYQTGKMIADLIQKKKVAKDDLVLQCKLVERDSVTG